MTKGKAQTVIEQSRDDLKGVLERLAEIAEADATAPYLADATAFLTQGVVSLEKHLLAEFDVKPPEPKPEPAPGKARMEDKPEVVAKKREGSHA